MKKTLKLLALICIITFSYTLAFSQCTNLTAYMTATAPSTPTTVQISTCTFQSEYNTINGVQAGETYISNYTIGGLPTGCITVHEGTPGGPVVAFGNAPIAWVAPSSGTYYIHYTLDCGPFCATAATCGAHSVRGSDSAPP